jgi:type IV pilus assembly protein PilV
MRSQATILAYDIIDTMRTNTPSVNAGGYDIAFADATPTATNCYGADANCTAAEMATSDLNHWRTTVAASLPSGNGFISAGDLGATNRVSVIITWVDPYSADQGSERVSIQTELAK